MRVNQAPSMLPLFTPLFTPQPHIPATGVSQTIIKQDQEKCETRGLKQDRSARIVIAGHAFVQNVRRGYYELAIEEPVRRRVAVAFDELALAI